MEGPTRDDILVFFFLDYSSCTGWLGKHRSEAFVNSLSWLQNLCWLWRRSIQLSPLCPLLLQHLRARGADLVKNLPNVADLPINFIRIVFKSIHISIALVMISFVYILHGRVRSIDQIVELFKCALPSVTVHYISNVLHLVLNRFFNLFIILPFIPKPNRVLSEIILHIY